MAPEKSNKSLIHSSQQKNDENPSQLGDAASLKAETSNNEPTKSDRGAKGDGQTLKQKAESKIKENPSQLGDPVSLKAETADSEPTDQDRGARGPTKASQSGKSKM